MILAVDNILVYYLDIYCKPYKMNSVKSLTCADTRMDIFLLCVVSSSDCYVYLQRIKPGADVQLDLALYWWYLQ